jgi:hypothetical protein
LGRQGAAANKLKYCKDLIEEGLKDKATIRLVRLITDYSETKAAAEAKKLLKELGAAK